MSSCTNACYSPGKRPWNSSTTDTRSCKITRIYYANGNACSNNKQLTCRVFRWVASKHARAAETFFLFLRVDLENSSVLTERGREGDTRNPTDVASSLALTKTMLIIEGNADIAEFSTIFFRETTPYQVIHVADSFAARGVAQTVIPQIILLDYFLPGMSGPVPSKQRSEAHSGHFHACRSSRRRNLFTPNRCLRSSAR